MHYSGFWRRLTAGLIDHILAYGIVGIILSLLKMPVFSCQTGYNCIHAVNAGVNNGWFNNVHVNWSGWLIVSAWLYFSFFESSKYQATPGMMLLSMRIEDYQKKRISFWRATGRFFASYLSSLFLCIGYIMIAFTPRKQGLHDYIAKTLVVTVK
ncbi:MAG TPA: RDD family protein [Alphaproteobacteria bacterium]|nr:RDD family protein [Alphaproteobacteria bacterium]HQS94812.1 RDD family protein [Alphaproteobacteria bacterium]